MAPGPQHRVPACTEHTVDVGCFPTKVKPFKGSDLVSFTLRRPSSGRQTQPPALFSCLRRRFGPALRVLRQSDRGRRVTGRTELRGRRGAGRVPGRRAAHRSGCPCCTRTGLSWVLLAPGVRVWVLQAPGFWR